MKDPGGIIKVTFEYKKEIHYLEGKIAQKWLAAADGAAMMEWVHGNPFPKFPWKIVKK